MMVEERTGSDYRWILPDQVGDSIDVGYLWEVARSVVGLFNL